MLSWKCVLLVARNTIHGLVGAVPSIAQARSGGIDRRGHILCLAKKHPLVTHGFMRLRHIEIFYHVYQEGSISAAARVLNVSQPSVSKTLRHAEDQLGFALFERTKGRLSPTPQAEELFSEVREIYAKMASFDRTAINIRGRSGGHIRLGVLPSLGFAVVPRFIAQMRMKNGDLSFDVRTVHTEEMVPSLVERRYDLCLGFGCAPDPRVSQTHIGDVELVLLSHPNSTPKLGETFDLAELDGRDMVGLEDSGPAAELTRNRFENAEIEPAVVVTAHTHYVAASLVRLGVGASIVDEFTARSIAGHGLNLARCSDAMHLPFTAMQLSEAGANPLLDSCMEELRTLVG